MTQSTTKKIQADIRAAALSYASRGWRVLPVKGKFPPLLRSKQPGRGGVHMATNDPDKILRWWTRWPWANVAIAMGEETGLVAIDVDGPDGEAALITLQQTHEDLPQTLETRTGRAEGGRHMLFRYPKGRNIGNKVRFAEGLDTRAVNGYIIAPPSIHPETGSLYEWKKGQGPDDLEPALLPAWLADMVEKPIPSGEPAKRGNAPLPSAEAMTWAANVLKAAWPPEGKGFHQATLSLVGGLLRAGWPPAAVDAFARKVATRHKSPRRVEIPEAIRTSDRKLDEGATVTGWPDLSKFVGDKTLDETLTLLGLREPSPSVPEQPAQEVTPKVEPRLPPEITAEGTLYDVDDLERDQGSELISLAKLPGWATGPGDLKPPSTGHGWGGQLDAIVGGGLRPGDVMLLNGSAPDDVRTAFALQLIDGLILRSQQVLEGRGSWPPVLTPVVLLTDLTPAWLAWHSLARLTGADIQLFREGRSGLSRDESNYNHEEIERAWIMGKKLLEGVLGRARTNWLARVPQSRNSSTPIDPGKLATRLARTADQWKQRISEKNPGRLVVPIIVIDPIERAVSSHMREPLDAEHFVRSLRSLASQPGHEFIVIPVSTNSSRLDVLEPLYEKCSFVLTLTQTLVPREQAPGEVEVHLGWVPWRSPIQDPRDYQLVKFAWYRQYARFVPLDETETMPIVMN